MNQENQRYYEQIRQEELPDIHSKGTLLRHKKSGARLLLIENDDENKVFDITFRTTPVDSTGVAHIMEHSVLCGSREFPLKDPFVELVKGSLNTFLNAMTYPDKTTYPVASCNEQDFQNLMHVYLDAVFYPNIYRKEEIFRQEGWHYQLEDVNGPLIYNGVVYNEMKGAFSSADDVLERGIMNSLFPDTTYGCESGGDPKNIPELTYEQFLDFHRKYYHPSNSYIYLYGNMDMDEKLKFLNDRYLSAFEYLEVDSEIGMQKAFDRIRDLTMEYPIAENEELANHTYLSYNMQVGDIRDITLGTAFEILDYALLSAPGAPLKQALLDAQIGDDVYGSYEDGILQPYFSVVAKGSDPEKKEQFVSIIRDVLEKIASNGIDKKAILAGINYQEFRYREADFSSYPKGLMYGLDILSTWLYDEREPFGRVQLLRVFEDLKKKVHEGYFEELIRRYLLDNPHGSLVTLVPSKGLAARREEALAKQLDQYLQTLSTEERNRLMDQTKALEAWQESEDNPEDLKCIPMLERGDIKKEADRLVNEERRIDDSLFLYHDVVTNGIGYVDLLFELKDFAPEEIPYLGLLKSVLGYVDTEHYTYGELFNEINGRTGGLSFGIEVFEDVRETDAFSAMYGIRGKALYSQLGFLYEMIREVVKTSKLTNTRRLQEIIAEVKSRAQSAMQSAGHATAVLRASSYSCPMAAFQDAMSGIAYYQFIEKLDKEWESRKEETVSILQALIRRILRPENLKLSYTGERESLEQIEALTRILKQELYTDPADLQIKPAAVSADLQTKSAAVPADAHSELPLKTGGNEKPSVCRKNEGFTTSGQVQYVAQTGNFVKHGFAYTGALGILKVALSYDYLWMNIRVKGGAYGCMSGFRRSGESFFASYRDPHLGRTLDVYRRIPEYIRNFHADERDMTKYIIGTISGKDVPKTPQMKGNTSKVAYFCGITQEMIQQDRDQVLYATEEDIRALAPLIESILEDDTVCVVGSETAIRKEKDLLEEVKPLIS